MNPEVPFRCSHPCLSHHPPTCWLLSAVTPISSPSWAWLSCVFNSELPWAYGTLPLGWKNRDTGHFPRNTLKNILLCGDTCHMSPHVVRGQLAQICSSLLSYGPWGLNLGHQPGQQMPSPASLRTCTSARWQSTASQNHLVQVCSLSFPCHGSHSPREQFVGPDS